MTREFTGRHMAIILIAFFGVVVAVNLLMARLAGSTFGGIVVENSYVASQKFNHWLDEAAAEKALGWQAAAVRLPDGKVEVTLSGMASGGLALDVVARHPLGRMPDRALAFVALGGGRFVSTSVLPQGRWRLRLAVRQDGKTWRSEGDIS